MKPLNLTKPALAALSKLSAEVFPAHCELCLQPAHQHGLCQPCLQQLPGFGAVRCRRCAVRLPQMFSQLTGSPQTKQATQTMQTALCASCMRKPAAFDATFAAFDYRPPADSLILNFKFGRQLRLAPHLAGLLRTVTAQSQDRAGLDLDALVPTPLARERLASRGFNQAQLLAQQLSVHLRPERTHHSIPVWADALLKPIETAHQAHLPLSERSRNIGGAYVVNPDYAALLQGKRIGVVDDVMTTGSTLTEAARSLKQGGASYITNLVIARTP